MNPILHTQKQLISKLIFMAWFEIHNEVTSDVIGEWRLCFQWYSHDYDNGTSEDGDRIIWRKPNGHLQAARGQARIDSPEDLQFPLNLAREEGWY